jgi:hypothetical protein
MEYFYCTPKLGICGMVSPGLKGKIVPIKIYETRDLLLIL